MVENTKAEIPNPDRTKLVVVVRFIRSTVSDEMSGKVRRGFAYCMIWEALRCCVDGTCHTTIGPDPGKEAKEQKQEEAEEWDTGGPLW